MKHYNPNISYFAYTNYRQEHKMFGIKQADRMMHTYILGKTGTGKTNLLISLLLTDIFNGRGCCVFDVHGDMINILLPLIPQERKKDILHLDIPNLKMEYRYNPIRKVSAEYRPLVVSGILESFKKLAKGAWGYKQEHILRYLVTSLLFQDKADLSDIVRLIHNESYRKECIGNITDKDIRNFWLDEFPNYTKNDVMPVLNKVGSFLAHPAVKQFLISNKKEVSFRHAMDNSKIVLIDLSKGKLGIDASHILGAFLLNAFMNAGFSRINLPPNKRVPFHLFLDEFQSYSTETTSELLSEIRKFSISLTMAHQHLFQLEQSIRHSVLGNVGTMIMYRVGSVDSSILAKETKGVFEAIDFMNLPNYFFYLILMIDGRPSKPFSAISLHYKNQLHLKE